MTTKRLNRRRFATAVASMAAGLLAMLGWRPAALAMDQPEAAKPWPPSTIRPGDVWRSNNDVILIKGVVTTEGPNGCDGYVHDQAGKEVSFSDLAVRWHWVGPAAGLVTREKLEAYRLEATERFKRGLRDPEALRAAGLPGRDRRYDRTKDNVVSYGVPLAEVAGVDRMQGWSMDRFEHFGRSMAENGMVFNAKGMWPGLHPSQKATIDKFQIYRFDCVDTLDVGGLELLNPPDDKMLAEWNASAIDSIKNGRPALPPWPEARFGVKIPRVA